MSSNVWMSVHYRVSYPGLRENLRPGLARTKAFSSGAITQSERQTLAGIGDRLEHNEKLLTYLERSKENYLCLVDIVSEMGCEEEAERLRRALLESEPEAKRPPSHVYPLNMAYGEAVSEAERLEADTHTSPLVFEASPSSSDTGIGSDVNEDVMRSMKIFVWRGKCDGLDAAHIRQTLKKNFKLKIEREFVSDDSDEEETHVQKQQGDAITTVKIVIGVDEHATESQRKEVVAHVLESLRWCGVKGLSVRCVDDGSIVTYALIPISDLIRLYQVAEQHPGVLAGIGVLEISTLGRTTAISFRTSPAGPVREPIHPLLASFIGDIVPGQAQAIMSSEPNMHHAVRALVSSLPVDGEAFPKVIKWLEKHPLRICSMGEEGSQRTRSRRMAGSSKPSKDQEQAFSSEGPDSATCWNSFKTTLLVVGAVAIVLAFWGQRNKLHKRHQREVAFHQVEQENTIHVLSMRFAERLQQRDKELHEIYSRYITDLQGQKEAELAVADFFKGRLNSALVCYRMMRRFVQVLGKYAERQIKKTETAGILDKIFSFLTTDDGDDSPVLDGISDPYTYVACLHEMEGNANGLNAHGGRLDNEAMSDKGKRKLVSTENTGAKRLAEVSMGEAEDNDEDEEDVGGIANGVNALDSRLDNDKRFFESLKPKLVSVENTCAKPLAEESMREAEGEEDNDEDEEMGGQSAGSRAEHDDKKTGT